jgi:hypothetical protein
MDYLYDIEDCIDISDWFEDDENDVQNTEVDEDRFTQNRCPICDRQLVKSEDGWDSCDYCGYFEKL